MDVVISLFGVLGLIAGLLLVVVASWDRQRSRRAVIEAETELRISREAAARQLLELRKRLAEAEADQAHIASLREEVRRLRDKNRRLQALHALESGHDGLAATTSTPPLHPPTTPPARSLGRPEAPDAPVKPAGAVTGARLSNFPELPALPEPLAEAAPRRPG